MVRLSQLFLAICAIPLASTTDPAPGPANASLAVPEAGKDGVADFEGSAFVQRSLTIFLKLPVGHLLDGSELYWRINYRLWPQPRAWFGSHVIEFGDPGRPPVPFIHSYVELGDLTMTENTDAYYEGKVVLHFTKTLQFVEGTDRINFTLTFLETFTKSSASLGPRKGMEINGYHKSWTNQTNFLKDGQDFSWDYKPYLKGPIKMLT